MSRKPANSDFDVVTGPAPLRPLPSGSSGAPPAGLADRQPAKPAPRPPGLHEKPAR